MQMQNITFYWLKKKISNLVDSTEYDHYSHRAYFCGQNYIGTGCGCGCLNIINSNVSTTVYCILFIFIHVSQCFLCVTEHVIINNLYLYMLYLSIHLSITYYYNLPPSSKLNTDRFDIDEKIVFICKVSSAFC